MKKSLKIAGIMLILAGVLILLVIPGSWLLGYYERRSLPAEFDQESASAMALNQSILGKMGGAAEVEKLRELARAFQRQLHGEQTIARLEIPRIGINAVVVEGTADTSLRKGVGHQEGTSLPGAGENFAIAGDRVLYGAPFLNLNELSEGDEIKVKTTYGQFAYTVTASKIIEPEDTTILNPPGYDAITLITCDPVWSTAHRLVIQGRLESGKLLQP